MVYAYTAISTDEMQHLAYDAVAPGGALVITNPRSQPVLAEKEKRDGGSKKIARPFANLDLPGNLKLGEELYSRLSDWLRTGVLVVSLCWVHEERIGILIYLVWIAKPRRGPSWRIGRRCGGV